MIFCTGVDDGELIDLLVNAGLRDLLRRVGSLDSPVSWNWYDVSCDHSDIVNMT